MHQEPSLQHRVHREHLTSQGPWNLHWQHRTGIRMLKSLSWSGASQHPEINDFASGWSSFLQVWESVGQGAANSHLARSLLTQTIT